MDNSQRNPCLDRGGCGVDISSEMVIFDRDLATMADMLGKKDEASQFRKDAEATAALINKLMWDPQKRFYFDLTIDGRRAPVKTVAGFWPLLAGVPNEEQAKSLAAQLRNPKTFARLHRVPTVAADEPGFNPNGEYWRGSVWAPTDTMVIRGLERCGYHDLAREIAVNHLTNMGKVFEKSGTVWENYAPDKIEPGQPAGRDFVGWSGIGPILYLLEFAVGLQPDAPNNRLTWSLESAKRCGCERFRFNGHVATLTAEPPHDSTGAWRIVIEADGPFDLTVKHGGRQRDFSIKTGKNSLSLD
jgi:glycogen debranching enzyme